MPPKKHNKALVTKPNEKEIDWKPDEESRNDYKDTQRDTQEYRYQLNEIREKIKDINMKIIKEIGIMKKNET